jgi:quinoprotein glucose dehydrogenase
LRHSTRFGSLAIPFASGVLLVLLGGVVFAVQGAQTSRAARRPPAPAKPYTTWKDYGGGPDSSQYSALTQINRSNVSSLQVAWTFPTGDGGGYLFNPIVVDGTMYVKAKGGIAAVDAATGKELWVHPVEGSVTNRGMNYWESRIGRSAGFSSEASSFSMRLMRSPASRFPDSARTAASTFASVSIATPPKSTRSRTRPVTSSKI